MLELKLTDSWYTRCRRLLEKNISGATTLGTCRAALLVLVSRHAYNVHALRLGLNPC